MKGADIHILRGYDIFIYIDRLHEKISDKRSVFIFFKLGRDLSIGKFLLIFLCREIMIIYKARIMLTP